MIRITGLGEPSRGRCDIVAYHTHLLNTATKAEAEAGIRDDIALSPASLHGATLPITPTVTFIGDTPPPAPIEGRQWWRSSTGALYIWYIDPSGPPGQWIQIAPGGGGGSGGSGLTVDTGQPFRIIMLSNGSVIAIPESAVPPIAPTGLAAIARLTSVSLSWNAATGATSYIIRRDGVQVATTSNRTYRDLAIVSGNTYSYTVASVDTYAQRSPASAPVTAYIDPTLNVAPTNMSVTCWPTPIPTDGPAFIRVNATEPDLQILAFTLGVDAGSLSSTADPSVWVIRV